MKQRCNPPRLDETDWGQFDFTRWNLDGVAQDSVAKAIAGLTQQFFESPEWQEKVQLSMPQLQQLALGVFKGNAQELRETRAAAEREFEQRAVNVKTRSEEVRRAMAASAAPQTPEAAPDVYHLAVRVTGADPLLGFPGLVVLVADPRAEQAQPIATGTTDVDGNVTLTAEAELARELDKRDTTVSVLSPDGKILARLPNGVCIRLGQVETKVITLKESAETAPLKQAALEMRQGRESLLASAESRVQSLEKDREERLANLDCAVREADSIVADLEKPPDLGEILKRASARTPGAAPAGTAPPTGTAPPAGTAPPTGTAPPIGTPPGTTRPTPTTPPPATAPVGTRPGTVASPAPAPAPSPVRPAAPAAPSATRVTSKPAKPKTPGKGKKK